MRRLAFFSALLPLALACSSSDSADGTTAGAAGTGGAAPKKTCPPKAVEGALAATDVAIEVTGGLPKEESILVNDWNAQPNVVRALRPDGSGTTEVLRANRVWSMGASKSGDRLAFSVGDPKQEEHFGITIGDAIQQTWLYDADCGSVTPVSTGNLNDECHAFSDDGTQLFLCRREGFSKDVMAPPPGYDVGVVDLSTLAYTKLVAASSTEMALHPAPLLPTGAVKEFLFTRIGLPKGERSIFRAPIPGPGATQIRDAASAPVVTPDGKKYAYLDTKQKSIFLAALDGTGEPLLIVSGAVTGLRFSPDGTRVVYMRDSGANCSHVEVAPADGSAPMGTRVRDCKVEKDFVTEVAWVPARG